MDEMPGERERSRPSKSARKREMHRLQTLGERLASLSPGLLAQMPIADGLREALTEAQRIRGGEARRRHMQYLGKLMRGEDAEAVTAALERLQAGGSEQKRQEQALERWRERLIAGGDDDLEAFVRGHPTADRGHLRRLIRAARRERGTGQTPMAARKLFRALRDVIGPV
jgi:ribosome-associated protein